MALFSYFAVALLSVLGAWLYPPVRHFTKILGIRPFENIANVHGSEIVLIPDTIACEDLEYHEPSGLIYTACSDDLGTVSGWMPGAGALEHPDKPSFGSIKIIDPATKKVQKLSLKDFEGRPFSTHGISLYTPPSKPDEVYIFAVNHVPNPRWTAGSEKTEPKAASQVELFVHTVGSKTARHLRSIAHPLIRTPNDLLALSESEFLVTNDHYYRDGPMRMVEEVIRGFQSWTDTVRVTIADDGTIDAVPVLNSVATNNGLSWGPDRNQVVIGDALGGHVVFASLPGNKENDGSSSSMMEVSHRVPVDCLVDNANFFVDPYAGVDGKDYSGYLLPGLENGAEFLAAFGDPTFAQPISGQVWYLPAVVGKDKTVDAEKLKKLVFRDDGRVIRSVTTSVMVPIDPKTNGGKREGWLFVTSVIGASTLATKIDFETMLG
ncbi:serum paraoxonase/arylesterase family protein [Poronia punctata]|nr:serum paraoxonase/arylesterase family protein [Poronia punctata]